MPTSTRHAEINVDGDLTLRGDKEEDNEEEEPRSYYLRNSAEKDDEGLPMPMIDPKDTRNPFSFISRGTPPHLDVDTKAGRDNWLEWKLPWKLHQGRVGLTNLYSSRPAAVPEGPSNEEFAKEKKDTKKYMEFGAACSLPTLKRIRSMGMSAADSKDTEKIIKRLDEFVLCGVTVRVVRCELHNADRADGESPEDYGMRLREIADRCGYEDQTKVSNVADRALDKFIAGLRDDEITKELLQKTDLDFEGAIKAAMIIFACRRDVRSMQDNNGGGELQNHKAAQIHHTIHG